MKRSLWIVLIALALSYGATYGSALAAPPDDDLVTLLEQEVENREANLKHAKMQFEAGMVGQDAFLQAERDLLQARQELARANRPQPVNPLTSPIPRLQISDADLGAVCELLKEVLEERVNFILKDSAGDVPVPDLDLRETDLLTLLNILHEIVPDLGIRITAGSRILPLTEVISLTEAARAPVPPGGGGMMGMPAGMMMGEGFGGEPGMFGIGGAALSGIEWSEQPTVIFEEIFDSELEPRETLTLYLGGLLSTMDFDDILTSIETAWDLNPARSEPTLRFHEDTELLIAAGEKKQLQMIVEVIDQLREMQEDLQARSKRSHEEKFDEMKKDFIEQVQRERASMREESNRLQEKAEGRIRALEEANARLGESKAMADDEIKAAREQFEKERNRMLTEMEDEIRQIRERSFYERRDLLEKIDALERELKRKLDGAKPPVEDDS